MAKILVTGANGYIGKHVVNYLSKNNVDFIGTDLCENLRDDISFIEADIFKDNDLYEKAGRPEILLHLAWRDGFVHNSINHINDLPMHYNFLKKLIDNGIKHVAILGSVHEIGFFEGSVNENTPTNPQSLYGISKDALRKSIELECKNKTIIFQWIRGYYIVGNSEYGCSIFSKITKAVKDGKKSFLLR